jgi:hypothetical protein
MTPIETVIALCKRWQRYWARPIPLTYKEFVEKVKAGGIVGRGHVYDVAGMLDLGNPNIFVALVKQSAESQEEFTKMQAITQLLMQDYVFAIQADELVFNIVAGPDGLTPLQLVVLSNEDRFRALGLEGFVEMVKALPALKA